MELGFSIYNSAMAIRPAGKLGCFGGLVLVCMVFFLMFALVAPWSFRIGGRWTLGFWQGLGTLQAESGGAYPLYVYFFPGFRGMSRLRLNGQRPTNSLRGMGYLCSAQGVIQRMDLTGDIYGTYLNTDGNQTGFRLLDWRKPFRINYQYRRYFDLYGRWNGPELVMQDDGAWERNFQPAQHNSKENAKVTFTWGSYGDFKKRCDATVIPEKARIPLPRN
jgi:hypothetical protein